MFKKLFAAALIVGGLGAVAPAQAAPVTGASQINTAIQQDGTGLTNVHYRKRGHRHVRRKGGFSVQFGFGPRYGYGGRYGHRNYRGYRGGYYRPAPVYRSNRGYSGRHHAYCEGRFRSYRRYDGTYQPYHGPRRRCNSPYDGI